jgi:AAA15 family ATPase/GTPase
MLVEFSVENYRSFRDKVTLSMLATADDSLPENVTSPAGLEGQRLIRSAVVYGANASGKSNLLMAMEFLRNLVLVSHTHQKGQKLNFTPFKMDQGSISRPSRFEIVFIKEKIRYSYGVSLNADRIVDEHLYFYPKGRRSLIFLRKDTEHYTFNRDKVKQKFISESTLGNVLYLSRATQLKYQGTAAAFDWFKDILRTVLRIDDSPFEHFSIRLVHKNQRMKSAILKALAEADVGIDDITAVVREMSVEDVTRRMPPEMRRLVLDTYRPDLGPIEEFRVTTIHKAHTKGGKETKVPFQLSEESEGTRRLFMLMGLWLDALEHGRVLIIDELDVKLHILLNELLVRLFHDATQNRRDAQLIFATHNTNLLNQDLFRRDQIWFTERNPNTGSSDLFSVVEFSPRKDKDLQKGYLAGRYGALPFIKEHKVLS